MGVEAQSEGHVTEDVLGSEVDDFSRVRYQLYVIYGWVVCDMEEKKKTNDDENNNNDKVYL